MFCSVFSLLYHLYFCNVQYFKKNFLNAFSVKCSRAQNAPVSIWLLLCSTVCLLRKVWLCSPSCPCTYYAVQAVLEFMILLPPTTLVCNYEQVLQFLAIAWKSSWAWAKSGTHTYFWAFLVDTWVLTKVSVGCSQETLYIGRTGLEPKASFCKAKLWWGTHYIIKPKCVLRHGSRNCTVKPENNRYKYIHRSPINVWPFTNVLKFNHWHSHLEHHPVMFSK